MCRTIITYIDLNNFRAQKIYKHKRNVIDFEFFKDILEVKLLILT